MVVNWKRKSEYHRPANVGAVITLVFIFQYLHDQYGWGRYRFHSIMDEFEKFMQPPYPKYKDEFDTLVDDGMDRQMYDDFLRWLPKSQDIDDSYTIILGHKIIKNKKDRDDFVEAADIAYVLTIKILHEQFNFKKERMKRLQRKLKFYTECVFEKRVRIIEFMDCMSRECGQHYGALNTFLKNHGPMLSYIDEDGV